MSDEERYELKAEFLTPADKRQEQLLETAKHTDKAIVAMQDGDIFDIAHKLVIKHQSLATTLLRDLSYYKAQGLF